MKKIFLLAIASLTLFSCKQDIVHEVDYNITLDPSNTMLAGDPVRFNLTGNVDNLIFYSDELGHKYEYKDRYTVNPEDVLTADLELNMNARYGAGCNGGMEIWVSSNFKGLDGHKAEVDRATMKAIVEGGMEGWTRIDYNDPANGGKNNLSVQLNDYLDNFCIAFHWNPKEIFNPDKNEYEPYRSYYADGKLTLDVKGVGKTMIEMRNFNFTTLMMDETAPDAYKIETGNGRIIVNDKDAALFFKGYKKEKPGEKATWKLDSWAISRPAPLNRVTPDTPEVLKNLQNDLPVFSHVYEEPGTYEVVFIGTNANIAGSSRQVKTLKFTILENPDRL